MGTGFRPFSPRKWAYLMQNAEKHERRNSEIDSFLDIRKTGFLQKLTLQNLFSGWFLVVLGTFSH